MADKLDITVFGATGFTGGLTAHYLAEHAPAEVRIGIAGRNGAKLAEVQADIAKKTGRTLEIVEASVDDPASLKAMAERTRVIATTVGPYARYGVPVVAAAVEGGADCLDITGEPEFVSEVLQKYDGRAKERGVRIIHCCGFDCIPADLGALYTVEQLDRSRPIRLEAFVEVKGTVSGGSWHSAVNAFSKLRETRRWIKALSVDSDRVGSTKPRVRYERQVGGWVAPMPSIDPRIVLRSAAAIDYGPHFRYGHYVRAGSARALAGLGIAVGSIVALSQLGPTKKLLLKWKAPGEGPDEAQRAKSSFRVTFVGDDGKKHVVTRVSGGDPGYTETSKMLAETALALVLDRNKLPDRHGVLTTAAATGDVLIDRLNRAGIRFETLHHDTLGG